MTLFVQKNSNSDLSDSIPSFWHKTHHYQKDDHGRNEKYKQRNVNVFVHGVHYTLKNIVKWNCSVCPVYILFWNRKQKKRSSRAPFLERFLLSGKKRLQHDFHVRLSNKGAVWGPFFLGETMGDAGELRFLVKHSFEQSTRFAESAENGNIDDLPMCAFWLNAAYGFLKKLAKTEGTMTNSLKYENPKIILENPDF